MATPRRRLMNPAFSEVFTALHGASAALFYVAGTLPQAGISSIDACGLMREYRNWRCILGSR
jgi:hypothetical protein